MPTPAILRDESDLRRVLAATKHVERQFNGEGLVATPSGFPTDPGMPMAVVRVVSSSPTAGGYWEGQIEAMAAGLHGIASVTAVPTWTPVEDAPVWVRESNDQPLIQDNRYLCTICQVYQGDSVAVTTAGGGGSLATRNVDNSQIGTTADMRFGPGVRITQSPGGNPWDVVEVNYGPSLSVVTNVCKAFDTYGAWVGNVVEKRTVTFPVGTTFGPRVCVTNPTDCCSVPLTCPGCPELTLPPLFLSFTGKTGAATCLPDSIALVQSPTSSPTALGYLPADYIRSGAGINSWTFCGGTYGIYLAVALSCRSDGFPGYVVAPSSSPFSGGAFSYPPSPLGDGFIGSTTLGGTGSGPVTACNVFASPGTLFLGTVTNPGGLTSTVSVYLSW